MNFDSNPLEWWPLANVLKVFKPCMRSSSLPPLVEMPWRLALIIVFLQLSSRSSNANPELRVGGVPVGSASGSSGEGGEFADLHLAPRLCRSANHAVMAEGGLSSPQIARHRGFQRKDEELHDNKLAQAKGNMRGGRPRTGQGRPIHSSRKWADTVLRSSANLAGDERLVLQRWRRRELRRHGRRPYLAGKAGGGEPSVRKSSAGGIQESEAGAYEEEEAQGANLLTGLCPRSRRHELQLRRQQPWRRRRCICRGSHNNSMGSSAEGEGILKVFANNGGGGRGEGYSTMDVGGIRSSSKAD